MVDDFTENAMEFIERNRDSPFFCYLAINTPHSPMMVPDRFYEKFDGKDLQMRNRDPQNEDVMMTRAALAMCENIDWNVGRILSKLKELDKEEDTVIIYMSDNGPNGHRWNRDMKGIKGSTDEGGVKSPFIFQWKGKIESNRRIKEIASALIA